MNIKTPTYEGPERRRRPRLPDWFHAAGQWVAVACIVVFSIVGYFEIQRLSRDEQHRIVDQRQSCYSNSETRAAQVNLEWLYYLSEIELTHPTPRDARHLQQALATLTPPERQFIETLSSGNGSRKVLIARADADYNAAYVTAPTVDYRLAHLINQNTALGSGKQPYRWVQQAHYDCRVKFR